MAELGAIASVVQLAAAAITSARALYDLIDTIKHAPQEISAISRDTHAFYNVVSSVQIARRDDLVVPVVIADPKLSELIEGLTEPLKNCLSTSQIDPSLYVTFALLIPHQSPE